VDPAGPRGLHPVPDVPGQREDQGPTAGCLAFPAKTLQLLIGKMDQIRCFRIHGRGRKPIKAQG
jgi:hypothetical protein